MKKNIAIIMGGYSSEYTISIESGKAVYNELNKSILRDMIDSKKSNLVRFGFICPRLPPIFTTMHFKHTPGPLGLVLGQKTQFEIRLNL
jgi:hypothetical protein